MFDRARAAIAKRIAPFTEIGVGGSVMQGGYPQQDGPPKPGLHGIQRWRKATEILSDISIVAASLRYTLNLMARPAWKAEPPSDKVEAKDAAEFMESVLQGCDTSWARIVRRSGLYRFHGFGIHEWTAKRREDGKIGLAAIEVRPGQTIQRWDRDDNGNVKGVWQRNPQNGREIYLPREKLVYLVDDALSDSPEGMGWFRHLVDPAQQITRYLNLEKIGFERDLAGIPIGRAPIAAINKLIGTMVPDGNGGEKKFTQADAEAMIKGIQDFVLLKSKQPDTGLLLDSQPFTGKTSDGTTVSTALQWGVELLTGTQTSIEALGNAIRRLAFDMALIMGTESLLVGREGAGSLALSENKSRDIYLGINAALGDMAEAYDRDLVDTIWALNGLPSELRPKLKTEDAAFRDVEQMARVLRDMGAAGAILHPNDPAINDMRALMALSPQPELTPDELGLITGNFPPADTPPGDNRMPKDDKTKPAK